MFVCVACLFLNTTVAGGLFFRFTRKAWAQLEQMLFLSVKDCVLPALFPEELEEINAEEVPGASTCRMGRLQADPTSPRNRPAPVGKSRKSQLESDVSAPRSRVHADTCDSSPTSRMVQLATPRKMALGSPCNRAQHDEASLVI